MSKLKILALVEATTVNAVARNVLDFQSSARELRETNPNFPPVDLSIVTFNRQQTGDPTENQFITAARAPGIRVDVISERGRFDRHIVRALREIVNAQKPDIVVTHSVKSHFVMFRSKLWQNFPWVAYHHGYTSTDLKMRFYNLFDRRSLPKADRVVTVCQAFADELATHKQVPREHISVLHNSIRPQPRANETSVRALREKLGIAIDDNVILSIGRLSKEKAQVDLIRAFAHLRQTNPELNATLVVVGDGPERAHLEAEARSEALTDRIHFTGHVTDVQPYYAIADMLANASHSEGSPYVLLEAMAAGVPIVATAVGGVPEMLNDGETALLVPPRNPQRLAGAIAYLLQQPAEADRLADNAKAISRDRFSPETYVRALIEVYRAVVANRRATT